jgi:signal recognition particle GTPase
LKAAAEAGAGLVIIDTAGRGDNSAPLPETVVARPQISRLGTKPITVHHLEEVRRQLKALAGEQGRAVEDVVAEAFNLLFAKYRKPEIAPVKARQVP